MSVLIKSLLLPKNARSAVLLASEGSPSCPLMKSLESALAPGRSVPAIMYTPSAYDAGDLRVSRLAENKGKKLRNKINKHTKMLFFFIVISAHIRPLFNHLPT